MGFSGCQRTDSAPIPSYGFLMEEIEQCKLIEALKKLIQGEESLVRQVKHTIDVVDERLHHAHPAEAIPSADSSRDKTQRRPLLNNHHEKMVAGF